MTSRSQPIKKRRAGYGKQLGSKLRNDTQAFGLLLSRIVVELQDIRATMSASVSRLHT